MPINVPTRRLGFFFRSYRVIFTGQGIRPTRPYLNPKYIDEDNMKMINLCRQLVIVLLAGMVIAPLAGCSNTFNGFGQDMEKNGEAIQRQF